MLQATVKNFIQNGNWYVPQWLLDRNPSLSQELNQITIPHAHKNDEMMWSSSDSGYLSLKEAYSMLQTHSPTLIWGNKLWNKVVPPSRSFLIWRIIHDKIPTDDKLWHGGCHLVSMFSFCGSNYDTTTHLFFQCRFPRRM